MTPRAATIGSGRRRSRCRSAPGRRSCRHRTPAPSEARAKWRRASVQTATPMTTSMPVGDRGDEEPRDHEHERRAPPPRPRHPRRPPTPRTSRAPRRRRCRSGCRTRTSRPSAARPATGAPAASCPAPPAPTARRARRAAPTRWRAAPRRTTAASPAIAPIARPQTSPIANGSLARAVLDRGPRPDDERRERVLRECRDDLGGARVARRPEQDLVRHARARVVRVHREQQWREVDDHHPPGIRDRRELADRADRPQPEVEARPHARTERTPDASTSVARSGLTMRRQHEAVRPRRGPDDLAALAGHEQMDRRRRVDDVGQARDGRVALLSMALLRPAAGGRPTVRGEQAEHAPALRLVRREDRELAVVEQHGGHGLPAGHELAPSGT